MPDLDAVSIARASLDDGFEQLPEHIRSGILAELARAVFGTTDEPGIMETLRAIRFWGTLAGGFGLVLQLVSTFQLQEPIKHFVVALCGGHF